MRSLFAALFVFVGLVSPLRADEMFTNVYVVPPTLMDSDWDPSGRWKPGKSPEERYKPKERLTAKAVLEKAGIVFQEGASAIYDKVTHKLFVRNTPDEMAKVEKYVESLVSAVPKQIYLTIREASFQGELSELLRNNPAVPPYDRSDSEGIKLFEFSEPSGGREESRRVDGFDSYDSFREELTRPPKSLEEIRAQRRIWETGSLTDPQFQFVIRRLSQVKEIEVILSPAVAVRPGQPALCKLPMKRYGVIPVLGDDEFTIHLDLFLPEHGKALFAPGETTLRPTIRTSVKDGGTVVIAEKNANGENRLIFVTAQIMDPAGMPIQRGPEEKVELPTKAGPHPPEGGEGEAAKLPGDYWKHVVREGETLESIGRDLGIGAEPLRRVNRLGDAPVKPGQILLVPVRPPVASRTEDLLKSLVLPGINFKDASLADSLATLQALILELHDPGLFPDATPVFIADVPEETLEAKITLRLTNVPATEAIRYIAALAQCRYQIEGREVRIFPIGK